MTGLEEEFSIIYGAPAKHADHKVGDVVRFIDHGVPGGENRGEILHRVEPTGRSPLIYVVTPDVGLFPVEIQANEIIE